MCKHNWLRHEDVSECIKCGLCVTHDGKVLHDRRFPGVVARAKKKRGGKKGARKRKADHAQKK